MKKETKNKKGNNNKIIIILMVAIVLVLGLLVLLLLNNSGKKSKKDDKKDTEIKEENDGTSYIKFYSDDESNLIALASDGTSIKTFVSGASDLEQKYVCKIECKLFDNDIYISNVMQNKKIFFLDDKQLVLYDLTTKTAQELGEYSEIGWLYDFSSSEQGLDGVYLKILDNNSGMYGIIDKDGNLIHEFNLGVQQRETLGKPYHYYANRYSIKDNLIVDYKNDKFGIVRITSNDIVVDYLYDDIELVDATSYKAKLNGEWNTYNY